MAIKVQRLNLPWKPLFTPFPGQLLYTRRVYSGTCKWNPNFNSIAILDHR